MRKRHTRGIALQTDGRMKIVPSARPPSVCLGNEPWWYGIVSTLLFQVLPCSQ